MNKLRWMSSIAIILCWGLTTVNAEEPPPIKPAGLFTLWQLPNQTPTQMMSYVLQTAQENLVVIDGGNAGDAPYLADFIKERGNAVEAWIITHPHSDHFGAICEILKNPGAMEINAFYGSIPEETWVVAHCSEPEQNSYRMFMQTFADAGRSIEELTLGQVFTMDGIRFEVLGIKNPEITANPINNSSLVFRVEDKVKLVLFTGDLGWEGGDKLLNSPLADRLPSDYVQMSHHGQTGTNEAFYRHVNPSYCLWPTPLWLWDVDNGGGKGSGPWKTLEVRAWMEKLPIKKHYLMHEGLQKIPATRAIGIQEAFEQETKASYAQFADEIATQVTVDFELHPQLILSGETATLTITARTDTPPNATLELWEDCYALRPTITTHTLDWKQQGDNAFSATWEIVPETCGNYLLHWNCDVPGDIPEFWRNLAVVDQDWAVMILNSTSHRNPRPEPDFHRLHLPFSYWSEILLFGARGSAAQFTNYSKGARQYGDDPGMLIFLGGEYVPGDKTVWYDEPEEVQRTVLNGYRELWEFCRFPKSLDSLYTYGMGNEVVDIAGEEGIWLLGALCANQNWGDGPFKINHWGMPSRPYFLSEEDFRKPGPNHADARVGIQQCERHSVLCRDYNCVYSFESGIAYALDQYAGITRPRIVDDMILSREMDFLECFLNAAEQAEFPYLFSCGFEMNGVWPEMAAINTWFMEYLVQKSRSEKIAFTNAAAAASFMRTHYERTPETALYLNDVYAGLEFSGKPTRYPDTMELENAQFRTTFRKGETLPYAQYDYTVPWNYPDWGNDAIPRKADGYVIPNTDDRFDITPKIIDTRPFTVSVNQTDIDDPAATTVRITVDATVSQPNLTLAVWDIPREFTAAPSAIRLHGAKRFVPIRAAYTDNFCGILIADIQAGHNEITLRVTAAPRAPNSIDLQLTDAIQAIVFTRDKHSTAYLFNTTDEAAAVVCRLPENAEVALYPYDSDAPVPLTAETTLVIEPGKCQRLTGLTHDQLQVACGL